MKLKFITLASCFAVSACTMTANQSARQMPLAVPDVVNAQPHQSAEQSQLITLERIMSDPDWIARSPENWYWGDDSNTIFYQQKQAGNPLRDLVRKTLDSSGNGEAVAFADYHQVADADAVVNNDRSLEAYVFKGNVFVKTLATGQVRQITHTTAYEQSVMFLNNGQLAYRVDDVFYSYDLTTGQLKELANLHMADAPSSVQEPDAYLAKEQHKLIDYIALQHRNAKLEAERNQQLTAQNQSMTNVGFYFGANKKVVHAELSPAGNYLLVSIADNDASRGDDDIMPNYVSATGNVEAKSVRARVANNRQYSEELYLLDLSSGAKFSLSYETLPGFDDDVLADVRKENYAREGKSYQSTKQARNIHVMNAWSPIKWHVNGEQVALMLEAWDNKDRWIATVDFTNKKLVSQHKLHDDAWINWSFNEFGWLNNSDSLYYLSEESGYSHLYVKPLTGKAKALTSGKFEVSDVTLTSDEQRFVFKANKKHPGIYEIYQYELSSDKLTALTDLGGMNDYALSPDESKLLIEHSEVLMPPELYVQTIGKESAAVRLTHTVSDEFLAMPWTAPNVVAIKSSHQSAPVYSKVYLPAGFDQSKEKRRAVMFSHGAGYLQNSHLGWSGYFREFMFHSMLVQQGYVVIDMDYRASKGYGRDWRTAIYRHMGKPEVEDMLDGVNWLVENANVDAKRVGTYGGSYGGFLTLMALFNEPETFQSGAALRLVSDWAYYNHGYTSNILNMPGDDAIAYERSSPIYFAEGLTKPLLINAPMVDDNVFFQDTVRLVQRLIELEKENFETAIFPVEPHGFKQPSSWLDEYRRIYKLFETTL